MRRRALLLLVAGVLILAAVAGYTVATRVTGSPEETARRYLAAWHRGDLPAMQALVAAPPADFVARHERFARDLRISATRLTPGRLNRRGGETAELAFTGIHEVSGLGEWPFSGTLRLGVRDGTWKVLWGPETLHPALAGGGTLRLQEIPVPAVRLTTRDRQEPPKNHFAEDYLDDLGRRVAETVDDAPVGYAIEAIDAEQRVTRLVEFRPPPPDRRLRTTLDRWTQAAAARALDGVAGPAALVAVRPSTGEVLAVADRLGGKGAFLGLYPPGSVFTVVTAAALLAKGVPATARVPCPARYTVPQGRTFANPEGRDHGRVSLRAAFALSCTTAFARLAVDRLGVRGLWTQAAELGFGPGSRLAPGTGAVCGGVQRPGDRNALAQAAVGQGTVVASPLCLAVLAAAIKDGTWRAPRLLSARMTARVDGVSRPARTRLDPEVVAQLRMMLTTAVTDGTARAAGLPRGTAGLAGVAETADGAPHAWFLGYRRDVAFCVFVPHGADATVAAQAAARFLRAL